MGRPSDAKQRLITAAKQVIFTQSYEAVSIDELCAVAGVNKSSFYHFFSSKQELTLAAIDNQWQWFEQSVLIPTFINDAPPQERLLHFFAQILEFEQTQKQLNGHIRGCPAGNLTLEMSSQDELIRARIEQFFHDWLTYLEHMLQDAKQQGIIPTTLDIPLTAQSLLAYFEGVMLLAKSSNNPSLLTTLRTGVLALMQYQGEQTT